MSESVKSAFEKYQFWAFSFLVGALYTAFQGSQADIKRASEDTRKEIVLLSHQVAILNTKLDNYDVIQKAMQGEIKEINLRLSVIEVKTAKFENELRKN